MKISYVVLNYNNYMDTIECVESIIIQKDPDSSIVIVDNHSQNDSYSLLKRRYANIDNIHLLVSSVNLGFAKGNNLGYEYAKKYLSPDFIVIINNDTIISQKEFQKLLKISYEKNKFDILGPDIITLNGTHQNPQKLRGIRINELRRLIFKYKAIVFINQTFPFIYQVYKKMKSNKTKNISSHWNTLKTNVQLHGACLVYSKQYIFENDFAFLPITFLYMEEDVLFYYSTLRKYLLIYDPSIQIIHKEDGATDMIYSRNKDKEIFIYKNAVKSAIALMKLMEDNND